jgi:hypothetical protein
MISGQPRSGHRCGRRRTVCLAASAIMGAGGCYLLYHEWLWAALWPGTSWYWDGFWSILIGLVLGGRTGEWLARRIPRFHRSDGPGIFGVNCGLGIMAAVWLNLPIESAAILGAACRVILGAYVGALFAELMTAELYGRHPTVEK